MKSIVISIISLLFLAPLYVYAENYYLSPYGSDSSNGMSPNQAWASLQHAETIMIAGDTLFIMGGTYTSPQRFHRYDGNGGSEGSPLVFKAYGDERAIFQYTNGDSKWTNRYWFFHNGADYVVIDGFSYLDPSDSLYIKLECREYSAYIIFFDGTTDGSDLTEHITIKGIEIDGNFQPDGAAYNIGGELQWAVGFDHGRMDTLQSCYIHHVWHPTGDECYVDKDGYEFCGDGTDRAQGDGEAIFLKSCELCYIADNTFLNANHSTITIARYFDSWQSRFNKIVNNKIINYWGAAICVAQSTNYCLFEGNIILHTGESTTKVKNPFYITGHHNAFRRNATYSPDPYTPNPLAAPIDIASQEYDGECFVADSNMIYNNTFFRGGGFSVQIQMRNEGLYACAEASVSGTVFANNICYKSRSVGDSPYVDAPCEISLMCYLADDEHNWIEPDMIGVSPATTHFGGNYFHNNCIHKAITESALEELIIYTEDQQYCDGGSFTHYSLIEIENEDPIAWRGNIEQDPMLESEYPDIIDIWWHIRDGSPCIDGGTFIHDRIGAYVNSLYPGYGWDDLSYRGAAPDIGAYESDGESAQVPPTHQHNLMPGNK